MTIDFGELTLPNDCYIVELKVEYQAWHKINKWHNIITRFLENWVRNIDIYDQTWYEP